MEKKHRFKFCKLIRDKLPDIMRENGVEVFLSPLDKKNYIKLLKEKLSEEIDELAKASKREDCIEEMADVIEVIHALSSALKITMEEIEEKRHLKKEEKGGFEGGIYCSHVDISSKNKKAVAFYRANSDKYYEIILD